MTNQAEVIEHPNIMTLRTLAETPGAREALMVMLNHVPETDPDEAIGRIALQILAATSVEELNDPWSASGLRERIGEQLLCTSIRRLPSAYTDGLPYFLVLECHDGNGDRVVATTGATAVCLQLARAWQLGLFPVGLVARQSDKPSRNGYYPMHIELFTAKLRDDQEIDAAPAQS